MPQRPILREPRLWLFSFAIATVVGFAIAAQIWLSLDVAKRPASFLSARFLQPKLIPWYVWALLTPPLVALLQRMNSVRQPAWRSAVLYLGLGAASILVHSIASGFALGWWWSFPSLVPMDPEWHIARLLRSRTVFGVFMVGLVAVGLRASRRAPVPPVPAPYRPVPRETRIALRTRDRIVFTRSEDIDWIEADKDHVIVHVGGTTHRIRSALTAFESRLPPSRLIRVSRSAIVNLDRIAQLQPSGRGDYVITLRDGTKLTTGKAYRDRITRVLE